MPHWSTLSEVTRSRGLGNCGRTTPRDFDNFVRSGPLFAAATRFRSLFSPSAERAFATMLYLAFPRSFLVTLHTWHARSVRALWCFWFVHELCMGESRFAVKRPNLANAWGGGRSANGCGKMSLLGIIAAMMCAHTRRAELYFKGRNSTKLGTTDTS